MRPVPHTFTRRRFCLFYFLSLYKLFSLVRVALRRPLRSGFDERRDLCRRRRARAALPQGRADLRHRRDLRWVSNIASKGSRDARSKPTIHISKICLETRSSMGALRARSASRRGRARASELRRRSRDPTCLRPCGFFVSIAVCIFGLFSMNGRWVWNGWSMGGGKWSVWAQEKLTSSPNRHISPLSK